MENANNDNLVGRGSDAHNVCGDNSNSNSSGNIIEGVDKVVYGPGQDGDRTGPARRTPVPNFQVRAGSHHPAIRRAGGQRTIYDGISTTRGQLSRRSLQPTVKPANIVHPTNIELKSAVEGLTPREMVDELIEGLATSTGNTINAVRTGLMRFAINFGTLVQHKKLAPVVAYSRRGEPRRGVKGVICPFNTILELIEKCFSYAPLKESDFVFHAFMRLLADETRIMIKNDIRLVPTAFVLYKARHPRATDTFREISFQFADGCRYLTPTQVAYIRGHVMGSAVGLHLKLNTDKHGKPIQTENNDCMYGYDDPDEKPAAPEKPKPFERGDDPLANGRQATDGEVAEFYGGMGKKAGEMFKKMGTDNRKKFINDMTTELKRLNKDGVLKEKPPSPPLPVQDRKVEYMLVDEHDATSGEEIDLEPPCSDEELQALDEYYENRLM